MSNFALRDAETHYGTSPTETLRHVIAGEYARRGIKIPRKYVRQ